jgi:hypothetical protein
VAYKPKFASKSKLTSRRVSQIEDTNLLQDPEIQSKRKKKNVKVGKEWMAQKPSEFNAKKSFLGTRRINESVKTTTAHPSSKIVHFKASQPRQKSLKRGITNQSTHKYSYSCNLDELSNDDNINQTEFIIPKHLNRKQLNTSENVLKYPKDNPKVQSHTIHISELQSTKKKNPSLYLYNHSQKSSAKSSVTRPKGHKRVKSHQFINVRYSYILERS